MEEPIKTKVTYLAGRFHCRLIWKADNTVLNEMACKLKEDIAYCIYYMLRFYDKLGPVYSQMADAARKRDKWRAPKGKVWYPSQIPVRKR